MSDDKFCGFFLIVWLPLCVAAYVILPALLR